MLIPPKFRCSSCANTSPSSLPAINNSVACATIQEPNSIEHTASTTCLISLSTFFNKGWGYLVEKGWMVKDRFYARNGDHPLGLSNQAELGWKKYEMVTPLVGIKIHFDLIVFSKVSSKLTRKFMGSVASDSWAFLHWCAPISAFPRLILSVSKSSSRELLASPLPNPNH